jgi:hypothetical protein
MHAGGSNRLPNAVATLPLPRNWANSRQHLKWRWRGSMADHSEVAYTTADGMDYPAHEQTYEGFLAMTKYGTLAVIAIVALMAIFLT